MDARQHKKQFKHIEEHICAQYHYELNPKEFKLAIRNNPCLRCLYNIRMYKQNNFARKKEVA